MARPLLLCALLAALLPAAAFADAAGDAPKDASQGASRDLADLVACLSGGGVKARLSARIAPDGGGTGSLAATFEGVDGDALERLVGRANAHLARLADRLAAKGITVGKLGLSGDGGRRIVRTTAAASSVAGVPAALSPHDPVDFTAAVKEGLLSLRVAPRPALFLLAPFVRELAVDVTLPNEPAAHNAGKLDGKTLRWSGEAGLPTVEFSVRLAR